MMQSVIPLEYSNTPMRRSELEFQNPLNTTAVNHGQDPGQRQQPYSMNGSPQIIYVYQPESGTYENYKSRQSRFVGIGQIIIGILCVIFNATLIGLEVNYYYLGMGAIGHGIWGGVFFIIAGSFGISASRSKSKCSIIAFMVLSIISALCAAVIFSLGTIGAYTNKHQLSYNLGNDQLAMNVLLTILAVIEAALAIWGSVLGCKVTSNGAQNARPFVLPGQPAQQFVPVSTAQQAMVVLNTPLAMPHTPAAYPAGYTSGYTAGYSAEYPKQTQLSPIALAYQSPTGIQANSNGQGIVGSFMEKPPIED